MLDINIRQLFSFEFLFEKNPPFNLNFLYFVAIFVLLVIIGILSWFSLRKKSQRQPLLRPIRQKTFNLFFYTGLIGLLLSFFHWQQMAYLGSRFFFLVLVVVALIYGIALLNYRFLLLPKELQKVQKKENFEKYLPKKKGFR